MDPCLSEVYFSLVWNEVLVEGEAVTLRDLDRLVELVLDSARGDGDVQEA